jgi:hypothetical protein
MSVRVGQGTFRSKEGGSGIGAVAEPDCAHVVPEDVGCGDLSDFDDFRISNLFVSCIRLRFDPPSRHQI